MLNVPLRKSTFPSLSTVPSRFGVQLVDHEPVIADPSGDNEPDHENSNSSVRALPSSASAATLPRAAPSMRHRLTFCEGPPIEWRRRARPDPVLWCRRGSS